MKKLLTKLDKPADLNIAISVKVTSDWAAVLKKISPFASVLFILLNVQALLKRSPAITLLILAPLLAITHRVEVLRVIFAIALFWIFLEKLSSGIGKMHRWLAVLLALYAIVIFIGIFDPWFYLMMSDHSLRYKFILESHNALCILVFMIFIYLCETLLTTVREPAARWLKVLLVVAICALVLVFLFIKSRLYIGMSFCYLSIVTFKTWRQLRLLILLPAFYAGSFILLTVLSKQVAHRMNGTVLRQLEKQMQARDSVDFTSMIMNQRLLNTSSTGRGKLIEAFGVTVKDFGWQKFIYANNVDNYMTVKRRIPNINIAASSMTENSYLTVILSAGFVGLILLLYMVGLYISRFIRRREPLSLAFFTLLLAVWFFEESVMFSFSLIAHLFALSSINRIEKEDHEGSIGN